MHGMGYRVHIAGDMLMEKWESVKSTYVVRRNDQDTRGHATKARWINGQPDMRAGESIRSLPGLAQDGSR